MTVAVIPVKSLSEAKQRLGPSFSPKEREQLCLTMLGSLLEAVLGCEAIERCCVVTPDAAVLAWLSERYPSVHKLHEPPGGGLNEAFAFAARRVELGGAKTMLFLHGDLPLASSRDIGELADAAGRFAAAIVPDKHGTGTTALALTPPSLIYTAFGEGSFARHVDILNNAGIAYVVLKNIGLSMDIDSQEDMRLYDNIRHNDQEHSHQ